MTARAPTHRTRAAGRSFRPGAAALPLLIALAATLGFAIPAVAAPGDVVWRSISQRAPGEHDVYRSLAVGPGGNAYVAGSTTPRAGAALDVLVRAFGLDGTTLWRRVWTHPGRTADVAHDIARDRKGALIVAGSSGSSWLLLKYRSNGYLEWVRRGRSPYARCELAAVTVDAAGNVYATGAATPSGEPRRFFTIKYSSAGGFRWRATLGSASGDAAATDLVLGGGRLFVTGAFTKASGTRTAATASYSTAGGKSDWVRYHSADPADDAEGLAIAYSAGPYVMGSGSRSGEQPDGFVVRYAPDGAEQWVATYAGAHDLGDRFNALAVDGSGRPWVTGSRWNGSEDEMITLRFTALGMLEWEHALPEGSGRGSAVCGADGACYSAGGDAALHVEQITAAGLSGWETSVAPAGYLGFRPAAILSAGDMAVYVAGWAQPADGGSAAMLVRLRP